MRTVILSLVLLPSICAAAQPAQPAPPEGSNWQHVQALPMGASINVSGRSGHENCTLKSVDANTLTCTHGRDFTFQRADIMAVKISHRGRSALIGTAIGGGALAITGFAATTNKNQGLFGPNFLRGPVTAVFAVGGGLIGAIVGSTTDFSHSTVYKAP